jgi:putative hydrolase of the HAD superfamily
MSLPFTKTHWDSIDTVFLDMDGTLLDLHFDNHFWLEHLPRRYAEIKGKPTEHAREELLARYAAKRGSLDWYCLDYWGAELEVDIIGLKHEVAGRIAMLPGVESFLDWGRQQGKRLVIVTNAHRGSLELKLRHVALDDWIEHMISAHDLGKAKESEGFWDELQTIEAFDPQRTILIDDNADVLAAARHYGIRYNSEAVG